MSSTFLPASARAHRSLWDALGLGAVGLVLLDLDFMMRGGLGPVAVCVATALVAGPLLAQARSTPGDVHPSAAAALKMLGRGLALLVVAAAIATWANGEPRALWGGAALWWAVALLVRRVPLSGVVVPCAVGAAALIALLGAAPWNPWTLLEPHWETAGTWWATAMAAGLVLAAAGLDAWDSPREGAARRYPWIAVGAISVVAVGLVVTRASNFEVDVPHNGALVVVALAVVAGMTAVMRRAEDHRWWRTAVLGSAATLWFGGPASAGLDTWWGTVLPLGMALAIGLASSSRTGHQRWTGLLVAAVAVAAALGGPGLPEAPAAAAALSAVVVAMVWAVASIAVAPDLARR